MKKVKKIFEAIFITLLVIVFTIGVGYTGYFKLVPMLWNHGSSYAFQASITTLILTTTATVWLTALCIGCIRDVINLFKPTQPTTEESKT